MNEDRKHLLIALELVSRRLSSFSQFAPSDVALLADDIGIEHSYISIDQQGSEDGRKAMKLIREIAIRHGCYYGVFHWMSRVYVRTNIPSWHFKGFLRIVMKELQSMIDDGKST